jgi:hypothetical protein
MDKIDELIRHAETFGQNGMSAYTGYFPDSFHGRQGRDYYEWSQIAYDLIMDIRRERMRSAVEKQK